MKVDDMTNNDKVPELSGKEFDVFISKGFVFVDFFAEWCMPCLMMSPIIDELAEKFKGKIKFGKVNVDDNQQIAGKYKVQSIPNMILFKDGKQISQFIGGSSADELEEKLKKFAN
jgi:thioredoxin 1